MAGRCVIGAGFALPRDADRRSAFQAVRAVRVGSDTRLRGAARRCADRRSAFQAVRAVRIGSATRLRGATRRCAGLETGGPFPARASEHPGQLGEDRPVVHEFVVELGGSLLVGELERAERGEEPPDVEELDRLALQVEHRA